MAQKKQRLLTPLLLLFMATMVLANIAGRMHGPLESLYLQELGANVSQVGMFFTIGAIVPLLLQIFGGWLSDSIGRLQAIAIGSIGGVLAYVVYILAPSWEWLLLATVGSAMAGAFVGPSFMAFIAEQSTEETRGRVYGITDTLFGLVGVIGPVAGGYLAQGLNFKSMFLVAGSLYTAAALIRILMARTATKKETTAREKPSFSGFKSSIVTMLGMLTAGGIITWIFISDGVRDVAFSLSDRLTPLYLENIRSITLIQIGYLSSIAGVSRMVFLSVGGWISDKKGERLGIVGGFAILSVGWLIFLLARTFMQFAAAWTIFGIGTALISPAYNALISKVVPENLRGTAFGVFNSSLGLISLPAPWIGAQLWEIFSPVVPFFIPLVAMVAMLPLMWVKFKLPPPAETTQALDSA